jgi:dCTP deaminase
MILTGREISKQVHAGRIRISGFDEEKCTTNSYDLSLDSRIIRYTSPILDPKVKPEFELMEIPEDGLVLEAGGFILASTKESFGSNHYVPIIHAKSGIARMGLFVHVTADLIDIGSIGNSTLQLYSTLPVKVWPGMLIAQVTFWVPKGEITLYDGKYQGSNGPQPSKTWKDFAEATDSTVF